jgi:shikimate kinase
MILSKNYSVEIIMEKYIKMDKYKNIVLFGFMGTGKTCIGKSVAEKLGLKFVDMDDVVVERAGKSIPEIFAEDGEAHFRTIERQIVKDLAGEGGYVIATGGGVIKNPENVRDYSRSGLVICLSASPEVIFSRVEHDTGRPLLNTDDKLATIRSLLAERQHLYDTIPNSIDTSDMSADEVAARIASMWQGDA